MRQQSGPRQQPASSSSAASENEVDAKINGYIRQLQNLKKQTESKLYGVIYEATMSISPTRWRSAIWG